MEKHRSLKISDDEKVVLTSNYVEYFDRALLFCQKYYQDEINNIQNTDWNSITPDFLFKEYQWVVCTSGFNASIVSKFFDDFSECFEPLTQTINQNNQRVNSIDIAMNAMNVFSNRRKVKAIIGAAFIIGNKIEELGWEEYKKHHLSSADKLKHLPFIGDVTKYHLARNIGLLQQVKPDLHLVRLANYWKFSSPVELCRAIQANHQNLPLGIIDLVLFYTASTFGSKV